MSFKTLLGIDTNFKTIKGQKLGYMTGILYLAPVKESGVANVCPNASKGCANACLFTSGHGKTNMVRNARISRTVAFVKERDSFMRQLHDEINKLSRKAKRKGMIPVVRLNGTSDLPFEQFDIMDSFSDIQFYDYTKSVKRMKDFLNGKMPRNYHLTFSRSESNHKEAIEIAKLGGNVAVVFKSPQKTFHGIKVVSGDDTDLRFLDPKGTVISLTPKGQARHDKSGFVYNPRQRGVS